ncbi:alpha/beta hydrolase [Candidatus Saccharibacteria bacterium]|nr:alpha/beta hydrolase [Candidatus Saccharibacteria bacterium]
MTQYHLPVKFNEGSGNAIVLLHGLGNNHKSWSFVTEHMDYSQNRVIALDLLGFGDAPKPDVEYTSGDHAEAVIATLDKLGIEHAELTGHSMGCLVAIEVAKRRPDLVSKLVLLGAPIYKALPRSDTWSRLMRSGGLYFRIFSVVKKNPEAVQVGGKIADELVPLVKGVEITEKIWPAYRKSLENTIMQFQTYRDALELSVPTLYVNGIFDLFIIRRNNQEIAKRNKRYARAKTMLGPHEITPRQGKKIARILQEL